MKPGTWRMTVETLQAGQRRAYGPTVLHCRVAFESIPWPFDKERPQGEFSIMDYGDEFVIPKLKYVGGWSEPEAEWHLPKLKSLRKIAAGTWEFLTEEEYTG